MGKLARFIFYHTHRNEEVEPETDNTEEPEEEEEPAGD